jgi:hypothetical protein
MQWSDSLAIVKRIGAVAVSDGMGGRSQSSVTPGTPYGLKKTVKWGIVKEGKVKIAFVHRPSQPSKDFDPLDGLSLTEAPRRLPL